MRTEETVETVETTTEEVVYCDECTDECTDSFSMEPREVCEDCQSDDRATVSDYRQKYQGFTATPPASAPLEIVFGLLLPITFFVAILDGIDGCDYSAFYLSGAVSGMLWTAALMLLVLL